MQPLRLFFGRLTPGAPAGHVVDEFPLPRRKTAVVVLGAVFRHLEPGRTGGGVAEALLRGVLVLPGFVANPIEIANSATRSFFAASDTSVGLMPRADSKIPRSRELVISAACA